MTRDEFRDQYNKIEDDNIIKLSACLAAELEVENFTALSESESIPDPTQVELARIKNEIFLGYDKRQRQEKHRQGSRRVFKWTAGLVAAVILALSVSFLTVSAFRERITNFFFERFDTYSDIKVNAEGYYFMEKPKGWTSDYYPTYLPERFTFKRVSKINNIEILQCEDDEGNPLTFSVAAVSSRMAIDTENRVETPMEINLFPATLYSSPDSKAISLVLHDQSVEITIDGAVSQDEIIQIAENIHGFK